jgi:hypothetical protein
LSERRLRFRVKRGNLEVELEGEFEYVREKFEELLSSQTSDASALSTTGTTETPSTTLEEFAEPQLGNELQGILEISSEGRPHFIVPFDSLTTKEAVALMLFRAYPNALTDVQLGDQLSAAWKTTKPNVIRARAGELKKEGKLIAEHGEYKLSGAGIQWVRGQVLPGLRKTE